MSGLFKSIGKVFKKAVKVIKKIAVPALAVAAVVFTGGAALGVLPAMSSALGGVVSSLGLSSGLTSALTTGLTNAGFGALLGGKKGALMGFGSGLLGAPALDKALGFGGQATGANLIRGSQFTVDAAMPSMGSAAGSAAGNAAGSAASQIGSTIQNATQSGGGGGLGGLLGNPMIASQLLQGVGGGLLAAQQAKEERKQREREEANLSLEGGLLDVGNINSGTKFDPYAVKASWKYDPKTQQLVQGN